MTDRLPPPLLALFQPRPPVRYLPPIDRAPDECKKSTIGGVAQFLPQAEEHKEQPYNATESWIQRKWRQKLEKKERLAKQLTEGLHACMRLVFASDSWIWHANTILTVIDDPSKDPQARGDPYRTLFVARLSYDVKEVDLEREFGRYGPIERVCYVRVQFVRILVTDTFHADSHRP